MPTIVLLDVSLSMYRNVNQLDLTYGEMAVIGISSLLDYLGQHCKLEFVSLMYFSSLWERIISFTRDYDSIRAALAEPQMYYDKTNIVNALQGAQEQVQQDWNNGVQTNVILVTDGNPGLPSKDAATFKFSFPSKFHIITLASRQELTESNALDYYRKLIAYTSSINSTEAESYLWTLDSSTITQATVQKLFTIFAESNYATFKARLSCGNLSSAVSIFPPFEPYVHIGDFETLNAQPSKDLAVVGFMRIDEIASPPVISRHLVFSLPPVKEDLLRLPSILTIPPNPTYELSAPSLSDVEEAVNAMCTEDSKQPSLCVLLHGSLKVEGMVALCKIGDPDWYGILYSWADSKKKFNLMLSTFTPGLDPVSWLGIISLLDISPGSAKSAANDQKLIDKKSYSSTCVVWIKQPGLQSDIQKVVRFAKKLPDKMSGFYKELNKFRRSALALGFYDVIESLAMILQRERKALSPATHAEAVLQLDHVIKTLTTPKDFSNFDAPIVPLKSSFVAE